MTHKDLGYLPQWQKYIHGAEVIYAVSCLPLFHLIVWYVHNEWRSQHDRKESLYIAEEMTEKDARKEHTRAWHTCDKAKK